MNEILEMKRKAAELKNWLQNNLKESMTKEEGQAWDAKKAELDKVNNEIATKEEEREAQRKEDERKAFVNNLKVSVEVKKNEQPKLFKNLGEQLKAIKDAATTGRIDDRLLQINNAAAGMNEGIGSEGGFAVQTDIAGAMMETAAQSGQILSRVDKYQITSNSDSVKWMDIDESSVASTIFGGVQVYWMSEAGSMSGKESKPKLMERELKLEKLMGLAYATYELEQDSNFVSQLYTRAFEKAIQRELENCIVSGTGTGKPLGILLGGSTVTVSKETGQIADTVLYENIVKMYNRAIDKTSAGLVWLLHPDIQEQLDFMTFPMGVGGVPVYLPASAAGTLNTLKGKPIVESDQCSAIGDLGDIFFADLAEYLLIYKGGVDAAQSMHVNFLTAENAFRFIFRANGMPKKNAKLTIKNSSNQRSSFIMLQAR